jgi:Tfp pilus assembly protein PilO
MKLTLKNINWKTFLTTRRYLVFTGCVVGLTGMMVLGAIFPQVSQSLQLYQESQLEATKLKTLQSKVSALDQIRDLQQADRTKVDQILPSEKPLLQLITALNTVASQSQVTLSEIQLNPGKISTQSGTLTGISPGGTAGASGSATRPAAVTQMATNRSASGVEKLTVGLTVSGSLEQINQFLENIENVVPITDVTSIQLATAGRSTSVVATGSANPAAGFQAQLKLSTYFFTQPILATVEAPLPKVGAREQQLLGNLNTFIFPNFQKQQQLQGGGLQDLFGTGQ